MTDVHKSRQTPTKEERRLMMEHATRFAAEEAMKQKASRDAKTARLRDLRLTREAAEGSP